MALANASVLVSPHRRGPGRPMDLEVRRADGPRTGRAFEFAIREIAAGLVRVGQGASYREAATEMHTKIGTSSGECGTVINYLDAFADLGKAVQLRHKSVVRGSGVHG